MMLACGATPRNCIVAYAALVERQGRGAVAGDEAGDEGAVPGVVVRRLLLVDEVLPADDPAAAEVGGGGDAAVEDGHADAGARRASGRGRRDLVEADRQVGDVQRARVVEPEDRVVRDDEIDGVARGERVDLVLRQIRGDGVEAGEDGRLDAGGDGILYDDAGSRVRVHDDGNGLVSAGGVEDRRDARVDLAAVVVIRGQCRRGQGQETEQRDREDQILGSHLHRLHTSAPWACRLAQGRRTIALRRCLEGDSREALVAGIEIRDCERRVRQPSYLDHPKTSGFASLPHDRFAFVVRGRYRRLARES